MNTKVLEVYNLLNKNRLSDALQLAQKLYAHKNNQAEFGIVKVLGICLALNHQKYKAFDILLKANAIKKGDFEVVTNLAGLALDVDEYSKCFDFATISIQMKNDSHIPFFILSKLYFATKEFELSLQNILKAIDLLGGKFNKIILTHEDIVRHYFDILFATNKKKLVHETLKQIEKENGMSDFLFHYKSLMLAETINETDIDYAKQSLNTLQTYSLSNPNGQRYEFKMRRAQLNFGLGKYYLKKNYNLSDQYYIEGNKILLSAQRYKPLDHQKRTLHLINGYLQIKECKIKDSQKGRGLVFITGLPRSGTTLMESIVASNEDTFAAGELDIFDKSIPNELNSNYSKEQLEKIGDDYLKKIEFLKRGYPFFIDKLPANNEYIGLISITLPGAKIIHMKRNLWEVATSIFQQFYFRNVAYASSFFSIAVMAANYEELTRIYLKHVPSQNLLQINYEDLVSNSENLIPKIYSFCNINAEYKPLKRMSHVSTTASVNQVRSDIHQNSLKKDSFLSLKEGFIRDLEMQRAFWAKKNIDK